MTRSFVVAFAILILVVVGGKVLSPQLGAFGGATAAMPSLQEPHATAGVHKLPLQDIKYQSLIYPSGPNEEARPKL